MTWRPVVQFTPVDGDTVEFCSNFATPVRYKPGQPVPVCYRASRPQSCGDRHIQPNLAHSGQLPRVRHSGLGDRLLATARHAIKCR